MALVDISRIEPDDLAGDKFDDVDAVGSILEESAMDSLELHDDELATDGGSNFKDFLKYKFSQLISSYPYQSSLKHLYLY